MLTQFKNIVTVQTEVSRDRRVRDKRELPSWVFRLSSKQCSRLSQIFLPIFCCLITFTCFAQNVSPFQLASPQIMSEDVFFVDSTFVKIELAMNGVEIYYTLDGSAPDVDAQLYTNPIVLTESAVINTIAVHQQCQPSAVATMHFFKAQKVKLSEAALIPMPNKNYPGDGVSSLTDHQKGSLDFRDGLWLGIAKENVEVEYTFIDTVELSSVTVSTISDPNSWIFPPVGMEVWTTDENGASKKVGEMQVDTLAEMEKPNLQFHTCTFEKCKTTKLKVRIKNTNTIPEWHLRAGKGTWLFVDELIFE